ncbi:expressed unknown protein [Seminavis robusta]|uniref:Uncharacterized protein n=1 Tax=Seminavis robusta TaxID=568900 RepID=A0A9N8H8A4_9STRA|nr:expressed unknown protein [Seminavis robusta]|eukprot:Sro86_g045680.1 n/a (299) ;mRNA; f:45296-46192
MDPSTEKSTLMKDPTLDDDLDFTEEDPELDALLLATETNMDPLSMIEQFAVMHESSEIHAALSCALAAVDVDVEDPNNPWHHTAAEITKKPELSEEVAQLHDQVLRSATRILFAEQEATETHTKAKQNVEKLLRIETGLQGVQDVQREIKSHRSEEEKVALKQFRQAMAKARQDYEDARQMARTKRRAKLHLVAAAQERLETLRISHEEMGRIYAKKTLEQQQKLKKERLLYNLHLESLAKAALQEQQDKKMDIMGSAALEAAEDCSTTSDESSVSPFTMMIKHTRTSSTWTDSSQSD